MENFNMMKKVKVIISCVVVTFVALLIVATISFVQVGKARRASADYERQLEQLKDEKSNLEDGINYLESEEGQDDAARDQGMLPEGEYEIVL